MRWKVSGTDANTGQSVRVFLRAPDETSATAEAGSRGINVVSVAEASLEEWGRTHPTIESKSPARPDERTDSVVIALDGFCRTVGWLGVVLLLAGIGVAVVIQSAPLALSALATSVSWFFFSFAGRVLCRIAVCVEVLARERAK